MQEAADDHGQHIRTIFFPAGNTIAMQTADLAEICRCARSLFPNLERITVYGSSQYIHKKGSIEMKELAEAGLSRIHVGLESGDDNILKQILKGTNSQQQIEAGKMVMDAGIELSLYVILGIGGQLGSRSHALETARVLNQISPHFIRLRTFVPKSGTPLLKDVNDGKFVMSGPHDILRESALLIGELQVNSYLASDHYTNYLNVEGRLPDAKLEMLEKIRLALGRKESEFRPFFIGDQ